VEKEELKLKEKRKKEASAKEKKRKEKSTKEKNKKEQEVKQEVKTKETHQKAMERHDKKVKKEKAAKAAEKKSKELKSKEKVSKERAAKERAAKEKANKERAAKERTNKERNAKERTSKERAAKERTSKERAAKERTNKERAAKERTNKERSSKERTSKERTSKERANKERANKERANKERANKATERRNKAGAKASFRCATRVTTSNNAGVIRVGPHSGYTMTGGGMINNYRHWNSRAGFEEMMPEGNNYRCDMGFGAGQLNCYNQACKMNGGITCRTWSRRLTRSGVMRVNVGAGYTLTGGGIYNHYRHFNARSGFEESFPEGNAWRGDMGFGWGDFTVYARGCKASTGRLHCVTARGPSNANYAHATCPSGYQLTGCGINNHYRSFNKLSGFEATHPSGNRCSCDSGFGTGRNTCYARCCKVV
jgi:hypothetical protein